MKLSDPQQALNTLLRGVAHDTSEDIRTAWQQLIAHGEAAVPTICEKLENGDWSIYTNVTQSRYLTGLLLVLAELDIDACRQQIGRLRKSNLHDLHARTVDLFHDRMYDVTHEFEAHGVRIRIDGQLRNPEGIRNRLLRWMRTPPPEAFVEIQTIDVIPAQPDRYYLGLFSYRYSGIVVTWLPENRSWLMRRVELFNTQGTLYHEIGHSVHQHSEPGQVAEQEDEANAYKKKMLRRAYPMMTFGLRAIFAPTRLIKRLIARLKGSSSET